MKVLMLSDFYPPIIGGMEKHVSLLSRELTKRGHEVVVCTTGRRDLWPSRDLEVRVFRYEGLFQKLPLLHRDSTRRYPPPIKDFIIAKKLREIVKKERPDIIHSHGWILYSFLSIKERFDIPLIVTLHGYDLICPKKTLITIHEETCNRPFTIRCVDCGVESYGLVKSFFTYQGLRSNKTKLGLVNKYIAVSSFVKEVCSKHLNLRDEDVVVIPNFNDGVGEEVELGGSEMLPSDFILFVGALSPHKGIDILIDAYQKLETDTKLVIIGFRHPSYSYKSFDNIIVIENAPEYIMKEAYSRCKFVVIPSVYPDPCPTVAFEAMSKKKAIIGSDVGGLADIIVHGKTGIFVPFGNSIELAKAMILLLSQTKKAEQMGINGYNRFIDHYTPDSVVPQIEKIYQELV